VRWDTWSSARANLSNNDFLSVLADVTGMLAAVIVALSSKAPEQNDITSSPAVRRCRPFLPVNEV
jgi:hypothetical protein